MKRIGIFGGTFDPVHNGHIKLADNAYAQFSLDEVWFMPAPDPPHKQDRRITPYEDRFAMIEATIARRPHFLCSDFEARLDHPSYTARTLTELTKQYPEDSFSFIIGEDSLYNIPTWYHPEIILELAEIIVAVRDVKQEHPDMQKQIRTLEEQYGARIRLVSSSDVDISSERIRAQAAAGRPVVKLVPKPVAEYIKAHGLYGPKQTL